MTQAAASSTSIAGQGATLPPQPQAGPSVTATQQLFKKCAQFDCTNEGKKLCARCQLVPYCGRECQIKAWSTHKAACFSFNELGMTKENFDQLMAPLPDDNEVVCEYVSRDGNVATLTQKEFREKTGISFVPTYRASPETFLLWKKLFSSEDSRFCVATPQVVEEFKKAAPRIALKEDPLFGGFGVVALESIKMGAIICFYTGEIADSENPKSFKSTLYSLANIDGSVMTGLATFINDGPPNCSYVTVKDYQGIPTVCGIVAARDIKAGETLLTSYGVGHSVKEADYIIDPTQYEKISQYCTDGRFYRQPSDFEESMMLFYILATGNIFLRLHLDGSLKIRRTEQALGAPWAKPYLNDEIREFFSLARFFESINNPDIKNAIRERLLTGVRILSLATIKKYLENDHRLSVSKIEDYRVLVETVDQIYLMAHRSLIGSYIKTKEPKPPFDPTKIKTLLPLLPKELEDVFNKCLLATHMNHMLQNWAHAMDASTALMKELVAE